MSKKVMIELNGQGVRALLKSDEMRQICNECASAIKSRCGDGYETAEQTFSNRVTATVYADSDEAHRDNAKNNTILKALK